MELTGGLGTPSITITTRTSQETSVQPSKSISVKPAPHVQWRLRWLTLLDYIIVSLIISPIIVSYWRSTWKLMEQLIFHYAITTSAITTGAVGLLITVLSYGLQNQLKRALLARTIKSVQWTIGYHVFLYVLGISTIGFWRGVWVIWNHLSGCDIKSHVASLGVGWGALILLRSLMNAIAAPLSLTTDISDKIFDCSSRFRLEPGKSIENFSLDVVFTCTVVYGLVVSLWRGIWGLEDDFLFPGDASTSALLSLGLGYGLVALALMFQYSAQSSSEAMGKDFPFFLKVALQDVLVTIGLVGVVTVWRGIWIFHDIWQTKHPVTWVLLTNHFVCILGLMAMGTGSSVYARGCMMDGESAIFPLFYIRYLVRDTFYEKDDRSRAAALPAGKDYPGCSCNHYCLLLNSLRERNSKEPVGSYKVRACGTDLEAVTIPI